MDSRTRTMAVAAASLLTLILSGCAAASPVASSPGAGGETAAPTETTSATGTPPATMAEPAPSVACDTLLTADEYARLADEGLALDDDDPYLLGPVMERMADEGALVCVWSKPASDISAWYARLEVGADGETWLTELEAEGWLEDTERGDGTYLAPAEYDSNYQPSVQLHDGVLHFGSYNRFLESVLELQ